MNQNTKRIHHMGKIMLKMRHAYVGTLCVIHDVSLEDDNHYVVPVLHL